MNNYEFIIASLPVPESTAALDADVLIEEIRSQCSPADNRLIDSLLDGFDPSKLSQEFYDSALRSGNAFIRGYFLWDLLVRNAKTRYLNAQLGRPEAEDTLKVPEGTEFDEEKRVLDVLSGTDILQRERGLDTLMWDKADELTVMHIFDIDIILAFIAKIKITDRWNKLDPETGRELFRSLVDEIRNTRQ